jgi:hypothetical protein
MEEAIENTIMHVGIESGDKESEVSIHGLKTVAVQWTLHVKRQFNRLN